MMKIVINDNSIIIIDINDIIIIDDYCYCVIIMCIIVENDIIDIINVSNDNV